MSALAIQHNHELITEAVIETLPSFSAVSTAANDDQKVNILLVDDDDVAAEWVIRCMKKYNVNSNIQVADDGQAALDILHEKHDKNEATPSDIVLLDLNMPGMNGFEFLKQMRADPALESTVVFILTTSNANSDRAKAYNENVAGYLLKDSTAIFNWLFSLLPKHINVANLLGYAQPKDTEESVH